DGHSTGSSMEQTVLTKTSERPYRLRRRHCGQTRAMRSTIDEGMGAPPQVHTRSEERSCRAGSNASSAICKNTVGVAVLVHPYSWMRRSPTAGSQTSRRWVDDPDSRGTPRPYTIPTACAKGEGMKATSCSVAPIALARCCSDARQVLKV